MSTSKEKEKSELSPKSKINLGNKFINSKELKKEEDYILDYSNDLLNENIKLSPMIEELQQMLDADGFMVSRSTVYNTVELLMDAKILRRHVFEGMQAQYERITLPHTHLICTTCGKVKEVRDTNFAAFMNARRFNAFNADHYSLYVYGTCSTCARKRKRLRQT